MFSDNGGFGLGGHVNTSLFTTTSSSNTTSTSNTFANIRNTPYTLKLLLSNDQCGALIGKGGSTVIQLQEFFGITLKLGGLEDLFPGTVFRPAIIRGNLNAIRDSLESIISILWTVCNNKLRYLFIYLFVCLFIYLFVYLLSFYKI